MTYFLIRHKASGEFMPQGKRDRDYSHWNPSTDHKFAEALPVPRLIDSRKKAVKIINMWNGIQNATFHSYQNQEGEWDEDITSKPDGRTKNDLEIVEINIVEVKQ